MKRRPMLSAQHIQVMSDYGRAGLSLISVRLPRKRTFRNTIGMSTNPETGAFDLAV
jgi:hypothetical protein